MVERRTGISPDVRICAVLAEAARVGSHDREVEKGDV
jgi:hypothetical protein